MNETATASTDSADATHATSIAIEAAPGPDAPKALLKRTFKLAKPLVVGSAEVSELTITEKQLRHLIEIERKAKTGVSARQIATIASLTNLAPDAVEGMTIRDSLTIARWLDQADTRGLPAKNVSLDVGEADEADVSLPQTPYVLELLVPIQTNGAPITHLTLNAPTMRTAIDAERFSLEAEQTAAFVASISGQIIPVITRLAVCDVRRIEAWADPFLSPGE